MVCLGPSFPGRDTHSVKPEEPWANGEKLVTLPLGEILSLGKYYFLYPLKIV